MTNEPLTPDPRPQTPDSRPQTPDPIFKITKWMECGMRRKVILFLVVIVVSLNFSGKTEAKRIDPVITLNSPPPGMIHSTPDTPATVKLLAIRVDFAPDTISTTSGDGSFNSAMEEDTSEYAVDPIPHDREYFQRQLKFLKNFYDDISNGSMILDIENAVYPLDPDSCYHLPHPMWHYNYNSDDPLTINGNYTVLDSNLALLFRDAWLAADSQDINNEIDFESFDPLIDCFVIFHAGVGQDFAFGYDDTPFDIPSAYMELSDLTDVLPDLPPEGVPVGNGYHVSRGMILPEAETQMGYNLGMHGHMAILFGHHIGLPNLYNSETGQSVIGWFGLMDQGSGKLDGLAPATPCAWSKVFMGWSEPTLIEQFPDTIEAPVGTIFKLPINTSEYFLIENIDSYVYWDVEDSIGVSYDSLRYKHYVDSAEYADAYYMLNKYISPHLNVEFEEGVLVNMGNWGIGRPASGLMIWHIDESVIDQNLEANRINTDPDRFGVYLEEADGAVDIGKDYWLFDAGYGSELGSPFDAFYRDNEAWENANPNLNDVRFDDITFPDAKSNSGAYSHIILKDFSDIGDPMSFVVENDFFMSGFPKTLPFDAKVFSADVDGDGGDELFAASLYTLYSWEQDGSHIPVRTGTYFYQFSEQIVSLPVAANFDGDLRDELAVQTETCLFILDYSTEDSVVEADSVEFPPDTHIFDSDFVIADSNLIYIALGGILYAYEMDDNSPIFKWSRTLPDTGKFACLLPTGGIAVACDYGRMEGFDDSGNSMWEIELPQIESGIPAEAMFPPVSGDVDRDGRVELIVIGGYDQPDYLMILDVDGFYPDSSYNEEYIVPLPSAASGPPSLADVDSDQYLEIIVLSMSDGIMVFERNGLVNDYAPYSFDGIPTENHAVVCGSTGDGFNLFFTGLRMGYSSSFVFACTEQGKMLPGFPLMTDLADTILVNSPLLYPLGGDSVALAFAAGNTVHAWKTGVIDVAWGSVFGDKGNSGMVDSLYSSHPPAADNSLMPDDQVYCWPNPNNPGEYFTNIRYYLNDYAAVNIKIYDMAGDKVDELNDVGMANVPNDTIWDLTDISSGVYFARVEAINGGRSSMKIIKIAVIK